jgi:hypothetical protein
MFEKVLAVILSTQRSPLAPLKKGGNSLKVPLFKGDLGGSVRFATCDQTFKTSSKFMIKNQILQDWLKVPLWLKVTLVLCLILGIFLRFYHLELKVYSFDETFTSTYMYAQHTNAFNNFDGSVLSTRDIQEYLFIEPEKNFIQTIQQIISKIYVFPPLYPILGLIWSYFFRLFSNDSLVIQRSFSAFLSLLALVGFYWLGLELFESETSALVAVEIAAISPLSIAETCLIDYSDCALL